MPASQPPHGPEALRQLDVESAAASWMMADSSPVGSAPMTPVLARDMTLMLGQLGVEMIRAAVVEVGSMVVQSAWSSVEGDDADAGSIGPDSAFPWAAALIAKLDQMPADHTLLQKLNPRHWAFAWRFGDGRAAVAAALYRDLRDVHSAGHTALVRLVCDVGLRAADVRTQPGAATQATQPRAEAPVPRAWPAFERRRRVRPVNSARRDQWLLVGGAILAGGLTLVATIMAFNQTAAQQSDIARLQAQTETTMTQSLSAALASGDYGDVQTALSSFASLGYFKSAVVTNLRHRVVSTAGKVGAARVGEDLPESVALSWRGFDLVQGTARHGQLLVVGTPVEVGQSWGIRALLVAVVLGCLASGAAAALLVLRWRRGRKA